MKQKRRKRRSKKNQRKPFLLLILSVFLFALSFYYFAPARMLLSDIPQNSQQKKAVQMGIDLSQWQVDVDYKKIWREGYRFGIIRTGFGSSYEDPLFETHYNGLTQAGLDVGVYHYSHATTIQEALDEAYLVLEILEDKQLDLPIFYDIETDRQHHLSKSELTQIVDTFITTLENQGYKVGVYAALSWYEDRLDMEILNDIPIWVANYSDYLDYDGPYDYWQFTQTGLVNGVNGYCDINILYEKES